MINVFFLILWSKFVYFMEDVCYWLCLIYINIVNIDKGGIEWIYGIGDREYGWEGFGWVVGVVW